MSTPPIHILHVDSDQTGGSVSTESVGTISFDFHVETVESPEAAIDQLQTSTYDAVISRYELDSTDGISFLSSVLSDYPSITTVLLTDDITADLLQETYAAGIDEAVPTSDTPETSEILTRRLQTHLDRPQPAKADGSYPTRILKRISPHSPN
ncbi:response regulator [Haladaptatus sp. NG-SE-30]